MSQATHMHARRGVLLDRFREVRKHALSHRVRIVALPGAAGRWCAPWDRSGRLRADILTGLPGAIISMPDGMATAVLASANPVQGLSASFAGPPPAGAALTPG